ncbi:catalase family peroxidase [Rheinheimera oceanensis]|uniref:catalase family peroxidase n=1 Tax=Rheinheimera oceanensis TaxID=2817449 RepID=UPI001BFE741A|nr:catalase family peroxidase [Rheinheimera oceanensis]
MNKKISVIAAVVLSMVSAAGQAQDIGTIATKTVDTFTELASGPHHGFRANHAKGTFLTGSFTPTAEAQQLSVAPHFQATVPVVVRFSTGTGVPALPDASPHARPYGMAIRFNLADGGFTDIVSISHNGFPVATPEKFLELLTLIKNAPADTAIPSALDKFMAAHPAAAAFAAASKPVPVSFANQPFFGVNSFIFENHSGKQQYFRYRIIPKAGEKYMETAEAENAATDVLMQEIGQRVQSAAVEYILQAQLPKDGDPLLDGSQPWPNDRNIVELGTLRLNAVPQEISHLDKQMFNPLALPKGITASADPVLQFRPVVYAVSFGRRL